MKLTSLFLSLFFFGQVAQATSPAPILLEYSVRPMDSAERGTHQTLRVLPSGEVYGSSCELPGDPHDCDLRYLKSLAQDEITIIESLIRRASKGEIVDPTIGLLQCLAIPFEEFKFTAANGRILLEKGTQPCGELLVNDTRASLDLVDLLKRLAKDLD